MIFKTALHQAKHELYRVGAPEIQTKAGRHSRINHKGSFPHKVSMIEPESSQELDLLVINSHEILRSQVELQYKALESQYKTVKEKATVLEGFREAGNFVTGENLNAVSMVKGGISFFEFVLPATIIDNLSLKGFFQKSDLNSRITEGFIKALNSGFNGLALIYKARILQYVKTILDEIKNDPTYSIRTEEEKEALKKWELNINKQLKKLRAEEKKYGLKFISSSFSLPKKIQEASAYVPSAKFSLFTKNFITSLGVLGSVAGVVSSEMDFRKAQKTAKLHEDRKKNLEDSPDEPEHFIFVLTKIMKKENSLETIKFSLMKFKYDLEADFGEFIKNPANLTPLFNKELKAILSKRKLDNEDIKGMVIELWKTNDKFKVSLMHKIREYAASESVSFKKRVDDTIVKRENITNENLIKLTNLLNRKGEERDKLRINLLKFQKNSVKSAFKQCVKENLYKYEKKTGRKIFKKGTPLSPQEMEVGQEILSKLRNQIAQEFNINLPFYIQTLEQAADFCNTAYDFLWNEKDGKKLQITPLVQNWITQFEQMNHAKLEFSNKDVRRYIDHQETIEQTTKNALRQIVNDKYKLEGKFVKFKLTESRINFYLAAAALVTSTVLTAIGLSTLPFGGAGLILMAVSGLTSAAGFGLFATSSYLSLKYRKSNFTWESYFKTFALAYQNFMTTFYRFKALSLQRKLFEEASKVNLAAVGEPLSRPKLYKASEAFEKNQAKIDKWVQKVKETEKYLRDNDLKDFASYAKLKVKVLNDKRNPLNSRIREDLFPISDFDALESLREGLEECDLSLLDIDTKTFLQEELGLDLALAQESLNSSGSAIVLSKIKSFFSLNNEQLDSFMKDQKKIQGNPEGPHGDEE